MQNFMEDDAIFFLVDFLERATKRQRYVKTSTWLKISASKETVQFAGNGIESEKYYCHLPDTVKKWCFKKTVLVFQLDDLK